MKTDFHNKDWARRLALKERLRGTRNWSIARCCFAEYSTEMNLSACRTCSTIICPHSINFRELTKWRWRQHCGLLKSAYLMSKNNFCTCVFQFIAVIYRLGLNVIPLRFGNHFSIVPSRLVHKGCTSYSRIKLTWTKCTKKWRKQ